MGHGRYSVPGEIRETADRFYRAIAKRNLKAIDALWSHAPYAAVAGPSGGLQQGWDAVSRYWEWRLSNLEPGQPLLHLGNMVCHAVGDVGWFSATERRVFDAPEGKREEEVRVTCVLERTTGGWEIVSYHASLPAPVPLAEAS